MYILFIANLNSIIYLCQDSSGKHHIRQENDSQVNFRIELMRTSKKKMKLPNNSQLLFY
jgi:hypothetical protein